MSGGDTTPGGRQEKAMSSRLLTMKFMQRAAASKSDSNVLNNSPSSVAARTPNFAESSAKRQKTSPLTPQSPHSNVSTPRTAYQSDDPTTSLLREKISSQPSYSENSAETQWVLNASKSAEAARTPISEPPFHTENESLPRTQTIGRRTFGQFKEKRSKAVIAGAGGQNIESRSSEEVEDHSHRGERNHRRLPQDGDKWQSKRRDEVHNDYADEISLTRPKINGISAAAGKRLPIKAAHWKNHGKEKRKN